MRGDSVLGRTPDHAAWSPPAADRRAILARIPPLPVGHLVDLAHCPTPPTTTTKSKPTRRWPSTTCASLEGQAPTSGRRGAVVDTAGDHADPGHPSRAAAGPPPRPTTSFPSDTTDAGGRTLDTWTLRRPHRTPITWTAPSGHRTLAPDTGQERGHGDDSTAGVRTSLAATPSDRTMRRPNRVCARPRWRPASGGKGDGRGLRLAHLTRRW